MSTPNRPQEGTEPVTYRVDRGTEQQAAVTTTLNTSMLAVQDRVAGVDPRVASRERDELRRKYGE